MYEKFPERWSQFICAAETVRTGMPQGELDYSTMSEEELYAFYGSQRAADTANTVRMLTDRFDFSSRRNLLDVGGGTGGLAIAFAKACPHLQTSVVDLPSVTNITRRFVEEEDLADRVRVISGDVTTEAITGSFDVAVMRNFFPVISRDQVRQVIQNVNQVLEPGGVIYTIDGGTLDDSQLTPRRTVIQNVWYSNVFEGGNAKTEQERREWFTEAGFVDIQREASPGGMSLMVAHKPG